jgi:hypothetical protein
MERVTHISARSINMHGHVDELEAVASVYIIKGMNLQAHRRSQAA